MVKQEKSKKVYNCCGQLFACTNATSSDKIICPRCGAILTKPISQPTIIIVKQV